MLRQQVIWVLVVVTAAATTNQTANQSGAIPMIPDNRLNSQVTIIDMVIPVATVSERQVTHTDKPFPEITGTVTEKIKIENISSISTEHDNTKYQSTESASHSTITEYNLTENPKKSTQTENQSTKTTQQSAEKESTDEPNEIGHHSKENLQNSNETENKSIEFPQQSTEQKETGTTGIDNNSGERQGTTATVTPESISTIDTPEIESRSVETDDMIANIVEVESGKVQGYFLHGDLGIRSYLDIPYGKFSQPFKPPEKPDKWTNLHAAKQHIKRCPQLDPDGDYIGDLDCLTLSVFTPLSGENLPVLFHIFDSEFTSGSANPILYGPEYFVTQDVILVLPNYRLGPLGFLCLRNELARGNAGLKDLAFALEWTKNNIANFGGNASNVIVSADGQAGALAGYLALSPKSRNNINGVITESGSVLAHWAIDRDPESSAEPLTKHIFKNMSEMDILQMLTSSRNLTFRPCVEKGEDAFINASPWKLLHEGGKINIPFIIGSAIHAGLEEAMKLTNESLFDLKDNFTNILPDDLEFNNREEKIEVGQKLKEIYFQNRSVEPDDTYEIGLSYTDAYYLGPALRLSRALVEAGATVYFYEFSFVGSFNWKLYSLKSKVSTGAVRGDLVGYTFVRGGETARDNTDEEKVVDLVTDLWITFLKAGVPLSEEVIWNNLEDTAETEENWLSIGLKSKLEKGLHVERLGLWSDIYREHFIERNLTAQNIPSRFFIMAIVFLMFSFYKNP